MWKIAKRFGSTVEDIARINGIEDENKIYPDQKLFIPHYSKASVKSMHKIYSRPRIRIPKVLINGEGINNHKNKK